MSSSESESSSSSESSDDYSAGSDILYSPPPSMASTCEKRSETSIVACPASKKPKIDDKISKVEFIEKFLECSICLDFPSSPIHSCANAHFLCGQCAPKLSACPTCQLPKLRPSPACEKLAKEACKKIQCANSEAGCTKGVLSTKFVDHLPLCYFREITCSYEADCGAKVKFNAYTKHLENVHYEEIRIGSKFSESYSYNEDEKPASVTPGKIWSPWGQTAVKFASHEFIVHSQISEQSQLYVSWVSVLGDKRTADKFIWEVKFKNPKSNKLGCRWALPVLAFHEVSSNELEVKLFKYSAVFVMPMETIKNNFGEMRQDAFWFEVVYEIKDA